MPHTILVADDSVTIQKVVDIVFEKEPAFSVVKVGNGDDAVARAKELRPSVILADHNMPGRTGYEVAEALKADPSTAGIPVILLTGSSAPFDEARAQAAGCTHLQKPFDSQSLLDRIVQAVGGVTLADPMGTQRPTLQPAGSSASIPAVRPAPAAAPAPRPTTASLPRPPATPSQPFAQASSPALPAQPQASSPGIPAQPQASSPGLPTQSGAGWQARPASRDPFGFGLEGGGAQQPATAGGDDDIEFALVDTAKPAQPAQPVVQPAQPVVQAAQPVVQPAQPVVQAAQPGVQPAPVSPNTPAQPAPATPAATAAQALASAVAPQVAAAATQAVTAATGDAAPSREAITAATREIIERIVWEVVPELAETLIREEIERLLKSKGG